MKKLLLALALFLLPSLASAQCNGVFPNNTACGNVTGTSNTPRAIPLSSFPANSPGGTNGQVQYNNAGAFGGLTNTQLTTLINQFTASLPGDVPASGGGTANFLRADGTWAATGGVTSLGGMTGNIACGAGLVCGSGSVTLYGQFWLGDYGAACNGTTNDATAIANAITAAGAIGGAVKVPAGTCLSNSAQPISAAFTTIKIEGISKAASKFSFPLTDGFSYTTVNGMVEFRDFQITCKTTNVCITVGSTSNAPQESTVERIEFLGGATELNIFNVGAMHIQNNDFFFCTNFCIQLQAPINTDGGDNWINNNFFLNVSGFAGTGTGIHYVTGGGWKITNNKINGFGNDIYIHPNMTAGQGMSAIQIQNNSLEGYAASGNGILIQNQGTTGNINNINITGNEMGGGAGSYAVQLQGDPGGWITNLNIVGNIVRGAGQAGCFFIDGANTINVTGNNCTDASTGSVGITITANSSGGFVGLNTITNYTTKVTNNSAGASVTAVNNGP